MYRITCIMGWGGVGQKETQRGTAARGLVGRRGEMETHSKRQASGRGGGRRDS